MPRKAFIFGILNINSKLSRNKSQFWNVESRNIVKPVVVAMVVAGIVGTAGTAGLIVTVVVLLLLVVGAIIGDSVVEVELF